jgi:hypothetical protein
LRYISQLALRALDVNLQLFQQHTLLDLVVAYDCTHFLTTHCSTAIDIQLYGDMEVRHGVRGVEALKEKRRQHHPRIRLPSSGSDNLGTTRSHAACARMKA